MSSLRKPAHTSKVNRGLIQLSGLYDEMYATYLESQGGTTTKQRDDVRTALRFIQNLSKWWVDKRA